MRDMPIQAINIHCGVSIVTHHDVLIEGRHEHRLLLAAHCGPLLLAGCRFGLVLLIRDAGGLQPARELPYDTNGGC